LKEVVERYASRMRRIEAQPLDASRTTVTLAWLPAPSDPVLTAAAQAAHKAFTSGSAKDGGQVLAVVNRVLTASVHRTGVDRVSCSSYFEINEPLPNRRRQLLEPRRHAFHRHRHDTDHEGRRAASSR
jgi:hypothetical protein